LIGGSGGIAEWSQEIEDRGMIEPSPNVHHMLHRGVEQRGKTEAESQLVQAFLDRANRALDVNPQFLEYVGRSCAAGGSTKRNGRFGDRASNFIILRRSTSFRKMKHGRFAPRTSRSSARLAIGRSTGRILYPTLRALPRRIRVSDAGCERTQPRPSLPTRGWSASWDGGLGSGRGGCPGRSRFGESHFVAG